MNRVGFEVAVTRVMCVVPAVRNSRLWLFVGGDGDRWPGMGLMAVASARLAACKSSCDCPCALGALADAEHCEAGEVGCGGEQVEVRSDFLLSSHRVLVGRRGGVASGEQVGVRPWVGWPGSRRAIAGRRRRCGFSPGGLRGGRPGSFDPRLRSCSRTGAGSPRTADSK